MCHFYALYIIAFAITCLHEKPLDLAPLNFPLPRNVIVIRSIPEYSLFFFKSRRDDISVAWGATPGHISPPYFQLRRSEISVTPGCNPAISMDEVMTQRHDGIAVDE